MKYFAHYCSAQDDPKIAGLLELHGFMGTGLFWHLCEVVAGMKKASSDTPEYRVNPKILAKLGGNHTQTVTKVIANLAKLGLIESREEDGSTFIKIPKLNNYTDENTKRNERERKPRVRTTSGQNRSDQIREEKKDLRAASPAPALGAGPDPHEEPGVEDPKARAEALKVIKAMTQKLSPVPGPGQLATTVKIDKAPGSEEPCKRETSDPDVSKPGEPKTVDPDLEAELELTRADIVGAGFDQARANQITVLLAEYHSGRIQAHELSAHLDSLVSKFEKVSLFEVDGVISRRSA